MPFKISYETLLNKALLLLNVFILFWTPTTTLGFYVFRPLNGKHKENSLCVLRASAVNIIFSIQEFQIK